MQKSQGFEGTIFPKRNHLDWWRPIWNWIYILHWIVLVPFKKLVRGWAYFWGNNIWLERRTFLNTCVLKKFYQQKSGMLMEAHEQYWILFGNLVTKIEKWMFYWWGTTVVQCASVTTVVVVVWFILFSWHTSASLISSLSSILSTVKQPWLMFGYSPGSSFINSFSKN